MTSTRFTDTTQGSAVIHRANSLAEDVRSNVWDSEAQNAAGMAVKRAKKTWYVSGAPANDSLPAGKLSP